MKRREFFKGVLGVLAALVTTKVVPKAEAKLPTIKEIVDQHTPRFIAEAALGEKIPVDWYYLDTPYKDVYKYKVTHITYIDSINKTSKGVWMLNHWCNGYYEAVPLYPGDFNSPSSAKWICNCKPLTKDELVEHNHLGSVVYQLPDPKPGMQFKFEATDKPIIIKG